MVSGSRDPQVQGRGAAAPVGSAPDSGPPGGGSSTAGAAGELTADYDFAFPPQAVAQEPPPRREDARLLLVPRRAEGGSVRDATVRELPPLLRPGDLLVLNDTTVLPARLVARRATGGRVSVLVLEARGRSATVMLGSRGSLQIGERLNVAGETWRIAAAPGAGRFEILVLRGGDVGALLVRAGRMPLPPYIRRDPEADPRDALDRERYQTTYAAGSAAAPAGGGGGDGGDAGDGGDGSARGGGAIAAPTAGLHFTPELLASIAARGVDIARLRLDVGAGTFLPLRGERLDEHVMHAEHYEIPEATAAAFALARRRGGRIVAVGTTVVRALESAAGADGARLRSGAGRTSLFICPGHRFAAVDALLTNFHQPRSTLLVLVSAFAGRESVRSAYAHAIARGYRLFSYGDAMLIA